MSIDLVSNMISALKNASMAGRHSIEIAHSRLCEDVAKVLKDRGFLTEVKTFKEKGLTHKMLHLEISYEGDTSLIRDARRVSKPGRRIYRGSTELNSVKGGMGVLVVSTSRGIMDAKEARNKKLGGELICEVY